MIHYISHKDINKGKWDECIAHSENSLVYAMSWFLDVVSPKWDALIYGDYEAVMPLPVVKRGIKYISQPVFTQQLGVFAPKLGGVDIDKFMKAIPRKFLFVRMNINEKNVLDDDK